MKPKQIKLKRKSHFLSNQEEAKLQLRRDCSDKAARGQEVKLDQLKRLHVDKNKQTKYKFGFQNSTEMQTHFEKKFLKEFTKIYTNRETIDES